MLEGLKVQGNQKFAKELSDTAPLFHPKHHTEGRTEQLQRVKTSYKEHFTEN